MAKTLSKTGITNGQTIQPSHVTQSIDAFTGTEAYDISLSGSSTVSGSLTVALPIPGKGNYNFDVSTRVTYTDLPFVGVNFTSSGLVAISEENSNMGQVIMVNSSDTIVSIPSFGGVSFSQSISGLQLNSGSIECGMGAVSQDTTALGGEKQVYVSMDISPDGAIAGNRTSTVEVTPEEARMIYFDASGQLAYVQVAINEFNLAGMQVYTPIASSTTSSFRIYNTNDEQNLFDVYTNGMVILQQLSSSFSASDDADAATKGIPTGGLYHTNGTVKIRLS